MLMVLIAVIVGAVVIAGLVGVVVLIIRAASGGSARAMREEELRLVQDIHAQMSSLEKRLESVEAAQLERMKER
jgi:hypothetical protein